MEITVTSGQLLRKQLFGILFLESHFQNHPDSVLLEKYQSLSNHSFQYNSAHMPSLSLTPDFSLNLSFVCSTLTVTPQIANICSLWTPCCVYLKSITLCNFISLFPSASLSHFLRAIGKSGAKKCFADHRTANTIQLFVTIKRNFSDLLNF